MNISLTNRLPVLVIFIFVLSSCNRSDVAIIEKWNNEKPKIILNFINRKDSTFTKTEYFESGQIKSKQDFVRGQLNGKVINYSDKGHKQQEFDYVDGLKNGIGTSWYESGKIAFQFKYKNGLYYDGTEYYEDGWPRVLVKFSAPGKREGKAFYFKEDGHIWQQGFFKNDLEDSIWTSFDNDGKITKIMKYRDGQIIDD